MKIKKTLIIGASTNPERYSYLAAKKLTENNHPVELIGARRGILWNKNIETNKIEYNDIDTVTLYINPKIQKEYYDYIIGLKPKRIIFNPGTENSELENIAIKNGIEVLQACTLVLLAIGEY